MGCIVAWSPITDIRALGVYRIPSWRFPCTSLSVRELCTWHWGPPPFVSPLSPPPWSTQGLRYHAGGRTCRRYLRCPGIESNSGQPVRAQSDRAPCHRWRLDRTNGCDQGQQTEGSPWAAMIGNTRQSKNVETGQCSLLDCAVSPRFSREATNGAIGPAAGPWRVVPWRSRSACPWRLRATHGHTRTDGLPHNLTRPRRFNGDVVGSPSNLARA